MAISVGKDDLSFPRDSKEIYLGTVRSFTLKEIHIWTANSDNLRTDTQNP